MSNNPFGVNNNNGSNITRNMGNKENYGGTTGTSKNISASKSEKKMFIK